MNPKTGKGCNCKALLDTGADRSMFPRMIAGQSNYKIDDTSKPDGQCYGISGTSVNVWKNDFIINLLDDTRRKIVKTSRIISIDCVSKNDTSPILGTSDFLKDFIITMNYPKKTFTLEWDNK